MNPIEQHNSLGVDLEGITPTMGQSPPRVLEVNDTGAISPSQNCKKEKSKKKQK